ncbi:MAG TPA: DNA-3-methyladenine glycosylase [Kineosporiaceae bacterium]|nr:DNA-3-methyladenine glycosylase [Kineosporiaceae bacterium]
MPTDADRLPRSALEDWSVQLAPALLGVRIVTELGGERVAVRLTEVEAYMGEDDPGSHAFRGPTPRTQIMFGAAGFLYVYFTYGMHWCANVVCGPTGAASAVLLRAGEVVEGVDVARARRPAARSEAELARGPARLTTALGIGGGQDGVDLVTDPQLWLEPASVAASVPVRTGPRVGIRGDGGDGVRFPWRFWLDGDPTVSTYRPGQLRRRARAEGDIVRGAGTAPAGVGEDRT